MPTPEQNLMMLNQAAQSRAFGNRYYRLNLEFKAGQSLKIVLTDPGLVQWTSTARQIAGFFLPVGCHQHVVTTNPAFLKPPKEGKWKISVRTKGTCHYEIV